MLYLYIFFCLYKGPLQGTIYLQQFNHNSSSCSGSRDHALCVCSFIEWGFRVALFKIFCRFTEVFSIPFSPSLCFWIPTSSSRVFLVLLPALLQYHSKPLCHCSDPCSYFLATIVSLTLLSLTQLSCSSNLFPFFQNPRWLVLNLHVSEELLSPLKMRMFSALRKTVSPAAAFSSSLDEVCRKF